MISKQEVESILRPIVKFAATKINQQKQKKESAILLHNSVPASNCVEEKKRKKDNDTDNYHCNSGFCVKQVSVNNN